MCPWIWFSEIKYSLLKINHLNDMSSTKADGVVPSTKAVGGGISVVCLTRTSRYRSKRRSWLVPLLPTFILSCLLTSQTNVKDFVDAKCRCNLVNWESSNFFNWESMSQNTQDTNILTNSRFECFSGPVKIPKVQIF